MMARVRRATPTAEKNEGMKNQPTPQVLSAMSQVLVPPFQVVNSQLTAFRDGARVGGTR